MTETPDWPNSNFNERYRCTYAPALAFSHTITRGWERSQEVVQDAFVVLHKEIDNGANMTRAWFFGIVRHKSLDALRAQKSRRKIWMSESEFGSASDDAKVVPFLAASPDKETPQPDQVSELQDATVLIEIMRGYLTEQERAIFDCKREEISDKDTALKLGVTEEAVKQRWKRIKSKLRDRLGANYDALKS